MRWRPTHGRLCGCGAGIHSDFVCHSSFSVILSEAPALSFEGKNLVRSRTGYAHEDREEKSRSFASLRMTMGGEDDNGRAEGRRGRDGGGHAMNVPGIISGFPLSDNKCWGQGSREGQRESTPSPLAGEGRGEGKKCPYSIRCSTPPASCSGKWEGRFFPSRLRAGASLRMTE